MKRKDTTGQTTRRTVIRAIGAAGITAGITTGIGAAQPDHARGGRENARKRHAEREQNRPGHKDFECPEGMEHLATFEFVVEEDEDGTIIDCYFEQTEGDDGAVTITDFDSKDDEVCEPVTVYYKSATHAVGQVSSFGGMDTHVDEEPEDDVYASALRNRGGQQAAISLLHFCGTLLEEDDEDDEEMDDGDEVDDDGGEVDDGGDADGDDGDANGDDDLETL